MSITDLAAIMDIESKAYGEHHWSKESFYNELSNELAHYFAAVDDDKILGYAGCWQILEEAHITNIAVSPEFRKKHIGEALLKTIIQYCYDEKVNAELVYHADLCVSPGNVGLTAIHSMMFGTPVITHNNFAYQMPEFEAIRSSGTGDFFEQGSIDSLALSIGNWFVNKSGKRLEVRNACFKEIDEQWNPYFQMKAFKSVLRK